MAPSIRWKKVADGVFSAAVLAPDFINIFIADGFLIDAGIRPRAKAIIRSLRDFSLVGHVLTHVHPDHQGASAGVCNTYDVPLMCGVGDAQRMENGDILGDMPLNNLLMRRAHRVWSGPAYPVSKRLQQGDKLGRFEVIETPGHTAGHISLWRPDDGALIVGDVVNNMNLLSRHAGLQVSPSFFAQNGQENRKSLTKLATLKPKMLLFGHGPALHNDGQFEAFAGRHGK